MAVESPVGERRTVAGLLTLTVVTGLIDAVSYLRLGRVFVANMTGNVVFLGFSVQPHSGLSPVASLVAIGGFVVGSFGGGRLAIARSHRTARWLGVALGTEATVIATVAALTSTGALPAHSHGSWATIAALAAALGLQNSTVRHLGVADLTTTVLTLSLTGLAADGHWRSRPARRRAASLLAMLGGAAAGAGLLQASTSGVIAVAAALVGVAAVLLALRARRASDPSSEVHGASTAAMATMKGSTNKEAHHDGTKKAVHRVRRVHRAAPDRPGLHRLEHGHQLRQLCQRPARGRPAVR
jgi:uncharacterized membrane protein YoaK (UPF0700 family)